jgi:hypothetical protein
MHTYYWQLSDQSSTHEEWAMSEGMQRSGARYSEPTPVERKSLTAAQVKRNILNKLRDDIREAPSEFNFGTYSK